jgi:glycosyltransferase involved in cell wall biosynthesis
MNQPLISIVLCTYNGEQYLEEQMNSLLAQTYYPFEVVVSDDCSTDGTKSLLERYRNDPRVKIVLQEKNLGPVKNFEFASGLAKGDFLAFSDQDDIWLPEKLEKLYAAIGDRWLVYSDSELINEAGVKLGKKLSDLRNMYSGDDTRGFIFSNVVWGHAMFINRKLLQYVLPIPENIPHDIWMAFKAATLTGIKYLDEPLTLYRQHSQTVTKTITEKAGTRTLSRRFIDYEEKLNWIQVMQTNERQVYQPFYKRLAELYALKQEGKFVWPLFLFLLKHRAAIFKFRNKGAFSQVLELRKQARGERK